MKVVYLTLIIISLSVINTSQAANKCYQCGVRLTPGCTKSTCEYNCTLTECSCTALCHTTVRLDDERGPLLESMCAPELTTCQDDSRNLNDIFTEAQITGKCEKYEENLVICECGHDACNNFTLFQHFVLPPEPEPEKEPDASSLPIILGCCVGVVILLLLIVCCVWRRRRRLLNEEEFKCKVTSGNRLSSDDASLIDGGWDESGKHSSSTYRYSSSVATQYTRGSRGNALNHNDHHLPIELSKHVIGQGCFAEVRKAKLQQDASNPQVVSVKIFKLRNYGAWRQEKDMLSERWMRHENIIEFYASEQHTVKGHLQYWLVTAYYQQGSLANFLLNNVVDWMQFCDMALSIAKGLSYLHAENDDTGRIKIPIAHRDIKSSNILVKDNCSSCVLADFGLSLKLDPEMTRDELSNAGQVGTSRYMAPELLERLVNLTDIEMFKRMDVYAAALVLWELANRCEYGEGTASPYMPPFGNLITDRPTKAQMLRLVCREKQKPEIPEKWKSHKGLLFFIDILEEGWDYEPESRITAGCIYERMLKVRTMGDVSTIIDDDKDEKRRVEKENEVNKITEIISTVV
uniref:receptor protein serine/threonine kinase n=1 Tax=Phallusia mammillata TaxID=59560 RepID=A0A6F9DVM8_9ASCI|nr:Tgfbr-IIb [Phallusia mammillata]